MKFVVSHDQKQHAYHVVYALQKIGKLTKFYTGIFFDKNNKYSSIFPKSLIEKRSDKNIDTSKVKLTVLPEIIYQTLLFFSINGIKAKRVCDRVHDWIVSKRIMRKNYDGIIGYEQQCYLTFKQAKAEGKITILDADSIHPLYKKKLNEQFDNVITGYETNDDLEKEIFLKTREYKLTDYFITISNFSKQTYIEAGIPGDKIFVLNLGVETDKFTPKKIYDSKSFNLLFVANIRHWKGIKDLVEVFLELNLVDATLTIIGDDGDASEYLNTIRHPNIQRFSRIPHDKLVEHYHRASVFILPSYMDSWGLVVTEAMACGTPVIVSENTGSKDIIEDGQNGFIVKTGDRVDLANKIKYFFYNRSEIEHMGKNAHNKILSLNWENYYKNLHKTILEIEKKNSLMKNEIL